MQKISVIFFDVFYFTTIFILTLNFYQLIAAIMFFIVAALSQIIFFHVALKWRKLIMFWERNELVFLKEPYKPRHMVKRKICFGGLVMFCGAAVEHTLSRVSSIHSRAMEAKYCNVTIKDPLEYFIMRDFDSTFHVFPYNPVLGVILYVSIIIILVYYSVFQIIIILLHYSVLFFFGK